MFVTVTDAAAHDLPIRADGILAPALALTRAAFSFTSALAATAEEGLFVFFVRQLGQERKSSFSASFASSSFSAPLHESPDLAGRLAHVLAPS